MKIQTQLILVIISFISINSSCNKNKTPPILSSITKDIKVKSLSELKSFLNGNWQMHFMISEIYGGGKEKTLLNDCFMQFFPVDSVKWTRIEPPLKLFALDMLKYIPTQTLYPGTGFTLVFKDIYNQERYILPDKTINDTLILFEDGFKTNYYLTRK